MNVKDLDKVSGTMQFLMETIDTIKPNARFKCLDNIETPILTANQIKEIEKDMKADFYNIRIIDGKITVWMSNIEIYRETYMRKLKLKKEK